MTKNKKTKRLSTKDFNHMVNVLIVENKHPTVSFKSLSKVETTRINQKGE